MMHIFPEQPDPKERFARLILSIGYLGAGVALIYAFWGLLHQPMNISSSAPLSHAGLVTIGVLGTWRYGWWVLNFIRAHWYGKRVFPSLRNKAQTLWQEGKRPPGVHILLATYHEREEVTVQVLDAVQRNIAASSVPATLWMSLGHEEDEAIVARWQAAQPTIAFTLHTQRQPAPGKRAALAGLLRSLKDSGASEGSIALLMDGDAILGEDSLPHVLSCFLADDALQAVTTNEEPLVEGPGWVREWYRLRFAQRRLWMQSHSLSGRVITLTGRCSAFRAAVVTDEEFIRTVEEDYLTHWLWGRFRFISGDDKSTWYAVLKHGGKMLYIPDAMVTTLEQIGKRPFHRMRDNLMRWSGNMLRNGMRALQLGPSAMPSFIWWCLLDQRFAIWTVPAGLMTVFSLAFFVNGWLLLVLFGWVMMTRAVLSLALSSFGGKFHFGFPLLLYCNQLATSFIKIYLLFRLPQQPWSNRHAGDTHNSLKRYPARLWMARYLTLFYLGFLLFVVWTVLGVHPALWG